MARYSGLTATRTSLPLCGREKGAGKASCDFLALCVLYLPQPRLQRLDAGEKVRESVQANRSECQPCPTRVLRHAFNAKHERRDSHNLSGIAKESVRASGIVLRVVRVGDQVADFCCGEKLPQFLAHCCGSLVRWARNTAADRLASTRASALMLVHRSLGLICSTVSPVR